MRSPALDNATAVVTARVVDRFTTAVRGRYVVAVSSASEAGQPQGVEYNQH